MEMKESDYSIVIKIILLLLALVIAGLAIGNGPILVSNKGSISLIDFASFYVWTVGVTVSLWLTIIKKNANVTIAISLLTYIWTWYLVNKMIETTTEVTVTINSSFYIYLSTAIVLIVSLFFNRKKQKKKEPVTSQQTISNNLDNSFSENNLIFSNFVMGIKGMPLNTSVLLVNNTTDNTFDLIYNLSNNQNDNKTIKYPRAAIKDIAYETRVKMQNSNKKVEENTSKSVLLSAVMLGGSPLLQFMGNSGFEVLFNTLSNNYDKVNYNAYYEITISTLINNQEDKLIVTSNTNPEEFINQFKNTNTR